jgi:hypothetical protein
MIPAIWQWFEFTRRNYDLVSPRPIPLSLPILNRKRNPLFARSKTCLSEAWEAEAYQTKTLERRHFSSLGHVLNEK